MKNKNLDSFCEVYREVAEAYGDCLNGSGDRNLNFLSSHLVTIDKSVEIFEKYVGDYNNFSPQLLKYLENIDKDGLVCIAREGSVCIYFFSEKLISHNQSKNIYSKMLVDEFNKMDQNFTNKLKYKNNIYRLWWD